jgi:tyrosine-protein phosphatase YwqE
MLSFFKFSSKTKYDFSGLVVDMHSHLLPAIDDGAVSVENGIHLITELQDMGFSTLYTTPHSIKDIHPNTLETLGESFKQIKETVPNGINFDYSSEYFLDEFFMQNFQENRLRPLPGNRLLIEFSMVSIPFDLEQQFFDIQMNGYQIILAHPERYLFFQKNPDMLSRLKDMDVEFQVNALSLGGYYGENARQAADKMIKKGWIDFIGTDTHHDKHIQALRKIPDTKAYQHLLDQGNLKNSELVTELSKSRL